MWKGGGKGEKKREGDRVKEGRKGRKDGREGGREGGRKGGNCNTALYTELCMDLYICTSVNEKIKKHFFSQSYKVDLGFVGAGILHNLGLHCDKRDKCLIYK